MSRITSIYCLEKNGVPFYIGRSINLKTRLIDHKKNYGVIDYFVLDEVTEKESYWERHYIELFKTYGFDLKNRTISIKKYEDSDIAYKSINVNITKKTIEIENDLIDFVTKQANDNRRSFTGQLNQFLRDQKNRTENRDRNDRT